MSIRDGSLTSHYDFDLPADRIAQQPTARRGDSRLMVVNRSTGEISHKSFSDLDQLIPPGDAIVLNTTRVFRARLLGIRENGTPAEVFLLRPLGDGTWEAMVHPGGKLKPDTRSLIKCVSWLDKSLSDFELSRAPSATSMTDVELHLRALPGISDRDKQALVAMVRALHDEYRTRSKKG